jgi:hypothetical protein
MSSLALRRSHKGPLEFAKGFFPSVLECDARMYGYLSREYIKTSVPPKGCAAWKGISNPGWSQVYVWIDLDPRYFLTEMVL